MNSNETTSRHSLRPATAEEARRLCHKHYAVHLKSIPLINTVQPRSRKDGKLRIGYLSTNFHQRPPDGPLLQILKTHDRNKIEVFAYASGPARQDVLLEHVKESVDLLREVQALSDEEIARTILRDGIDILIDLDGFDQESRLGIQALRPTPLVVRWLGSKYTLGEPRMADYLIGDAQTTPLVSADYYSEKLALMPHSCIPGAYSTTEFTRNLEKLYRRMWKDHVCLHHDHIIPWSVEKQLAQEQKRKPEPMKIAVITPYYKESKDELWQCHQSVLNQTVECTHFMIADGHSREIVDTWKVRHIKLPVEHHDGGCCARSIGSTAAISEGYDAIAFLDADNWYEPSHLELLIDLQDKTEAEICFARRNMHRVDGSFMYQDKQSDGLHLVDTSCYFILRPAFNIISLWDRIPNSLWGICDRIFLAGIKEQGYSTAITSTPTVAYRCFWPDEYTRIGETPPIGGEKRVRSYKLAIEGYNQLTALQRLQLLSPVKEGKSSDIKTRIEIIKKATKEKGEYNLFSIIRNELCLMPHFLEHYRNLGISHFLIYDDNSDDGTRDYLLVQDDCTIICSDHQFGDVIGKHENGFPKRFCTYLREQAPQHFFPDEWVLTVDADEFLVLPPEFESLAELTARLEQKSQFYITTPMVDFYPENLAQRNYSVDISPFSACPYFDTGPLYDWKNDAQTPIRLYTGIRSRLHDILDKYEPDLMKKLYGETGTKYPGMLWKVPLIKNGQGIHRIGDHEINIPPNTNLTAALAHFKFYPGLDSKISHATKSHQYVHSSREYWFLNAAIKHFGNKTLISEETRTYTGPQSLVDAGHIKIETKYRLDRYNNSRSQSATNSVQSSRVGISQPIRVAMFHFGRSGSTVLGDMLNQHKHIHWDGEIYEDVTSIIESQHGQFIYGDENYRYDPIAVLQKRLGRYPDIHYGFEVKYNQLEHCGMGLEWYLPTLDTLGVNRFIVLRRKNILRKIISSLIAQQSGVWHTTTENPTPANSVKINPDKLCVERKTGSLLELLKHYSDYMDKLDTLLGEKEPLLLTYEDDIENNPFIGFNKIIEYLDLTPIVPNIHLVKTNPFPLQTLVENPEEIQAYLAKTPYAWMTE